MLTFTLEHAGWILDQSPHTGQPKTRTGRMWSARRAKPGSIHLFALNRYKPETLFARGRILDVPEMRLWDITEEMAREEGCRDSMHYFEVFYTVNKKAPKLRLPRLDDMKKFVETAEALYINKEMPAAWNPMLFWPEFEVVDRCPGCEHYKLGELAKILGVSPFSSECIEPNPDVEFTYQKNNDKWSGIIGVKSCSEFKLKEILMNAE